MNALLAQLKEYFPDSEILCRCDLGPKCKGQAHLDLSFAEKLLNTRIALGSPMLITSGIRCLYWNDKQNGVPDSWHLRAGAVDIRSKGAVYNGRVITAAIKCGIMGIGIRGGKAPIIHLDNRTSRDGIPEIFGY